MHLFEPWHLIVVAVFALLFLGPQKLPELMRSIGKGLGEFQKHVNEGKAALSSAMNEVQHESAAESASSLAPASEPPVEPHEAKMANAESESPTPAPAPRKRSKAPKGTTAA